jgi:hypothetical protein
LDKNFRFATANIGKRNRKGNGQSLLRVILYRKQNGKITVTHKDANEARRAEKNTKAYRSLCPTPS